MMALWELLKNTRMDLSLDHIAESIVDVGPVFEPHSGGVVLIILCVPLR